MFPMENPHLDEESVPVRPATPSTQTPRQVSAGHGSGYGRLGEDWTWFICSITLPETNIAPKNGWLEYYFPIGWNTTFLLGWPIFKGYVSFRGG